MVAFSGGSHDRSFHLPQDNLGHSEEIRVPHYTLCTGTENGDGGKGIFPFVVKKLTIGGYSK